MTKPCRTCGGITRNLSGKCVSCDALAKKKWLDNNREKHRANVRRWNAANPEVMKQASDKYRAENKDAVNARTRDWFSRNRPVRVAHQMKREAAKLQATPQWANQARILAYYETANGLSMLLGEWYHVDHIVPLRGKTVCGLHNEFNLQVIPGLENQSKGNRHWPDM